MSRPLALLLALATLSVPAALFAQASDPVVPAVYLQPQPAPIERAYAAYPDRGRTASAPRITNSQPIPGVILRTAPGSEVQTVSATADVTELRVDHGRVNVSVHHPADNVQLLVDLPGGQTALVKDGLYTFNADTNTVSVLMGEADAFPGGGNTAVKLKEEHQFSFGASARPVDATHADLLPGDRPARRYGDAYEYGSYAAPYPYYAYGYPGFYGYPYGYYGYGYPFGFGIGFGYYGGFGGFRGGFGGFRGHR